MEMKEQNVFWFSVGSKELLYLKEYAANALETADAMIALEQIRALWTAFCIHQDMQVDTNSYDNDLLSLWNVVAEHPQRKVCSHLQSFEAFDAFMCMHLV